MGHFTRDCRAPRREQQWRSERRQGQSWGRQAQDEEELPEPEPRDKADSWLRVVAEEDDEVKNMILRDLVGKKYGFSQCLNPTAWVRALRCNSVYVMRFRSMRIPVSIRASYNMANIKALVDSGATDNFIHPNFVKRMGLGQRELDKPKNIYQHR
jgi:hypothetical protein